MPEKYKYRGSAVDLAREILCKKGEQVDMQLLSAMVLGEHLEQISYKLSNLEGLCISIAGSGLKYPLGEAINSVANSLDELQRKVSDVADYTLSVSESIAGLGKSHDPE